VAKEVGREPVRYVSNIFKYYIAYQGSMQSLEARKAVMGGEMDEEAGREEAAD